jgi:hypothetical protein
MEDLAKRRKRQRRYQKEYKLRYPERVRESSEKYRQVKKKQPSMRIERTIRRGIYKAIKSEKAGRHWESLVGYTLDDLMRHLESQFTKGMSWENYGKWHIDHIKPIADFRLTSVDDPELKECWSLWNLQPLWANDNQAKSARCEEPPLPLIHGGNDERVFR